MGEYILLGWATSASESGKNFGDELSSYIVGKLSGKNVCHVPFIKRWKIPFFIVKQTVLGKIKGKDLLNMGLFFIKRKYVLAIGSILQFYKEPGGVVWGAGIINQNDPVADFEFRAVRGKHTRNKLLSQGYKVAECYGDPAILLPLLYVPKKLPLKKIGIIPHVIHYDKIKQINMSEDFKVIDFRTGDIEKVVDEICSCEQIVSSSLHGLIVSHAYGIKALWYDDETKPLMGDGIKFADYFSSVNIKEYKPYQLNAEIFSTSKELLARFSSDLELSLPHAELRQMQYNLLKAAPFDVKPQYWKQLEA